MGWTLSESVDGEEQLQSLAPTPAAIVQHLQQLADLANDVDGAVDPEVNPEAYWKREVTYQAARLSELDAPPGSLLETGIIAAYFAGVARTHLEELVVDQPSLGKPLMAAAEAALRRSKQSAMGGQKSRARRMEWEQWALALAQTIRDQDRSIRRDDLSYRLQIALAKENVKRAFETISRHIYRWEKAGLLAPPQEKNMSSATTRHGLENDDRG